MSISLESIVAFVLELVNMVLGAIPNLVDAIRASSSSLVVIGSALVSFVSGLASPLVAAAMNLTAPILNLGGAMVNVTMHSNWDVVNGTNATAGDPGTPLYAANGFLTSTADSLPVIIGDAEATYGLTYILNSVAYVMENDVNHVGSELVYNLFNGLAYVVELLAEVMLWIPNFLT
ncbi:MAG: hypothetical protein SVY15_06085 [Halobacteriota archaeon]|nr:hypothetical protein [Halobacteriota archaeon]